MKTPLKTNNTPSDADIRAELDKVVNSSIFKTSPQLAAFLTFVVDAALAGETENLKGYTIAVGALGRNESFDPQADPIVRVEAGRLRRALERYYAEIGTDDPIRIELPRGSYVPTFEVDDDTVFAEATIVPPAASGRDFAQPTSWHRRPPSIAGVLGIVTLAMLVFGLVNYVIIDRHWPGENAGADQTASTTQRGRHAIESVMVVEPVQVDGSAPTALSPSALHARLSDAVARSDTMTLVAEASDARRTRKPDYRLASTLSINPDATVSLTVRLIDAADSTVQWTRKFDDVKAEEKSRAIDNAVVREIATRLSEPYGVLFALRRARLGTGTDLSNRERCYFTTFDYLRDRDAALFVPVRNCLEKAMAADPTYAMGHSLLSLIYLSEYIFNVPARPGDAKPLDRALASAVEAVRVKPASAFAHAALVDVYANRGALDDALAAGRKAMELNPYDATINMYYGSQLIFRGDIEQGRKLLSEFMRLTPLPPPRANYAMFIAAYISGDVTEAARYANRLTDPNFPFGYLARALVAVKADDLPRAREDLTRFYALQPAWKADPRGELRKHHPSQTVFDRLAKEIDEANRRTMM